MNMNITIDIKWSINRNIDMQINLHLNIHLNIYIYIETTDTSVKLCEWNTAGSCFLHFVFCYRECVYKAGRILWFLAPHRNSSLVCVSPSGDLVRDSNFLLSAEQCFHNHPNWQTWYWLYDLGGLENATQNPQNLEQWCNELRRQSCANLFPFTFQTAAWSFAILLRLVQGTVQQCHGCQTWLRYE